MADNINYKEIKKREEEWEQGPVREFLSQVPERYDQFFSHSGIPIKRIYTPVDVSGVDYLRDLNFPGQYPFTRGVYPTMYRARPWTFRPETGRPSPEETNAQFKNILATGATGLSLGANWTWMQSDVDPDDASFAELYGGQLGHSGYCACSLKDWEIMFDGISLDRVSTSLNDIHMVQRELAFYIAIAKKQGVSPDKLTGNCENDPLQLYYAIMVDTFPPEHNLRLFVDTAEFCKKHMPQWNFTSLSAYNRAEAGLTQIQELAFGFADAITYIEACLERGLMIDDIAPRFPFYFGVHNDLLENVAKLRAARRIWARLMRERFGAKNPESWRMKIHVQTEGRTTSARMPELNVIRAALQGLSAVLGGVQSLHITTFDEPLGTPTDYAQYLSVRTHQIIAYESGVTNTIDPLAGSYYVESLTNQIEEETLKLLREIEGMGGALGAIRRGFYLRQIERNVLREQAERIKGTRIVVEEDAFISDQKSQLPYQEQIPDPQGWDKLVKRLKEVRATRNQSRVNEALDNLKKAAQGKQNLIAFLIEAVEAYCTAAEINRALKEVWGNYNHNAVPHLTLMLR